MTVAHEQEAAARRVPATTCLACGGCGHRDVVVAGRTEIGSAVLVRKCATCDGSGRRPGFVGPA